MKWLRRAIPSAANLGPDTDSSFRPRAPPPSGAGVRSGYLEPPLPGAGSSVWVCRASLTRGRFIIPALCGRPFPSDCGVEGEAGGIASRTGRRLRSVLPYIPGVVLRGRYEKSVRKSRPRVVVGNRAWRKRVCGMKAQYSAAARLAERGVAGRMPFSPITIGCFETLTRHPAVTAFGGTSHPISLRDIRSGGNPRLCNRTHKPRPHSLPPASCTPPQRHVSRIFRADPGNPAGRVPTYAPTVFTRSDRIRFTFGKVLCRGSQTPPCNSRQ